MATPLEGPKKAAEQAVAKAKGAGQAAKKRKAIEQAVEQEAMDPRTAAALAALPDGCGPEMAERLAQEVELAKEMDLDRLSHQAWAEARRAERMSRAEEKAPSRPSAAFPAPAEDSGFQVARYLAGELELAGEIQEELVADDLRMNGPGDVVDAERRFFLGVATRTPGPDEETKTAMLPFGKSEPPRGYEQIEDTDWGYSTYSLNVYLRREVAAFSGGTLKVHQASRKSNLFLYIKFDDGRYADIVKPGAEPEVLLVQIAKRFPNAASVEFAMRETSFKEPHEVWDAFGGYVTYKGKQAVFQGEPLRTLRGPLGGKLFIIRDKKAYVLLEKESGTPRVFFDDLNEAASLRDKPTSGSEQELVQNAFPGSVTVVSEAPDEELTKYFGDGSL